TDYEDLKSTAFGEDPCDLQVYLEKALKQRKSDVYRELAWEDIEPSHYLLLQECQAISVSVERSFSKFKKLLAKDRQFNDANIVQYLMLHIRVLDKTQYVN